MSSDAVDLAIICSSKAEDFVENDNRFDIIPNFISNSSIVVSKKENPRVIGVSQNRQYEIDMVKSQFGDNCEVVEIASRALPYALEKGEVDAIVVDYLKSLPIQGYRIFPQQKKDFSTFSIVIRKELKDDKRYKKFITIYNETISDLLREYKFLELISKVRNKEYLDKGRKEEWKKLNLRILTLEK
ncbi:ABC transporter substrate-binding (seleno)protein SaoB [Clostridium sp.]|uniref:ABC transporter substrate-binding (seleno)protein SaoB n=1 Tax=Clostridium sp. TaxID=1506 RepID=UPI0032177D6E